MGDRVICFGIGATKSGTSWLHAYLKSHPQTHFRAVKELHFWDDPKVLDRANFAAKLQKRINRADTMIVEAALDRRIDTVVRLEKDIKDITKLRTLFQEDCSGQSYLDYLTDGVGPNDVVGDITPSYALLPEARLSEMQALSSQTKFIYLMRDPVARLWSHVRMVADRTMPDKSKLGQRAKKVMGDVLGGKEPNIVNRGDYSGTLQRMFAALDPARVMVLFYETLFSQDTLDRICTFLGLAPHNGDFDRRVMQSVPIEITDTHKRKAQDMLRPQYDYVASTMGPLPDAWMRNWIRA